MLITFYSHFTSNLMSLIDCQVVSSFSYRLTQSSAVTLWVFFILSCLISIALLPKSSQFRRRAGKIINYSYTTMVSFARLLYSCCPIIYNLNVDHLFADFRRLKFQVLLTQANCFSHQFLIRYIVTLIYIYILLFCFSVDRFYFQPVIPQDIDLRKNKRAK